MESVVLVIHLILALAIIVLVLLQRSEGGGLGIGGGGGLGGLATARGTASALTKMTGFCAFGFFITSLTLAVLASQHHVSTGGILENIIEVDIQAPVANDDGDVDINYIPPSEVLDDEVLVTPAVDEEKYIDQIEEPIEKPDSLTPVE